MEIIYRIEVHIFFMPTKHSFPWTNIYIWSIYSLNFEITKALPKIQVSQKWNLMKSYVSKESISAKFQGIFLSKRDPDTSAPYTGALCLRVLQNWNGISYDESLIEIHKLLISEWR
jgi:hypothetical protein